MDYYDFFPVLSLKETYLTSLLKMVKRIVLFSLVVILGILSCGCLQF
jgi:hypothetical protein